MTNLDDAVAVLKRTPVALREMLDGLPASWTAHRPTPESWTPYDVVGHLIHGERTDWIPRLHVILEHGAERPFTSFDREGMRGSAEDLGTLLDELATLRSRSLDALAAAHLSTDDLSREGLHPDLGRVTLGELLASWVVHDLSHVAQVAEAMAKRYRLDVGPWRAYLPVLDRVELPD